MCRGEEGVVKDLLGRLLLLCGPGVPGVLRGHGVPGRGVGVGVEAGEHPGEDVRRGVEDLVRVLLLLQEPSVLIVTAVVVRVSPESSELLRRQVEVLHARAAAGPAGRRVERHVAVGA